MTELASLYLGNTATDAALAERVDQALHHHQCLEVDLDSRDRIKGRIYTQARSGEAVGIVKDRSWLLAEGDVLQTQAGTLVWVHLQEQGMIVLSMTSNTPGHELALIHLGHTLGNHHYPIAVQDQRIYIQVSGDRPVIEATIARFQIPGLQMTYEGRSPAQLTDSDISFAAHHHPTPHYHPTPHHHSTLHPYDS
ncbi:MAG: urease accessory protein UreE [Synechococcales bacterium]|nr:urease accessory protein UreE [Synechococcales bacterium]